uniref:Uncharacterized protein n=1 Tax=Utricularia reniformis TaxID=192314 RepID=A0A1Y0B1A6_9LAMI|nr:hypothetical protein AEK19_MT0951 [Utricularia reniformis]ART31177.1 hypothetical protein AEK19_MT0951 [Utricularia reniformis]
MLKILRSLAARYYYFTRRGQQSYRSQFHQLLAKDLYYNG